jgi:hypothetical protein
MLRAAPPKAVPWMWVLLRPHDSEEPNVQAVTTIGLDIANSVFQIHYERRPPTARNP